MKKLALLLALTSAMIVSCSQGGNTKPKSTYRIDCTTSITEVPIEYYVDVQYSLSDFDKSSFTFNKSIALLSLAASLKANDKTQLQTFYTAIGFSGIVYSADYDLPDDKDAVKFTMAHYETSKYHLVSVVANGTSYEKPWESNFIIGAEGDATGFATGAEKVLAGIRNYIAPFSDKQVKLWLIGYSRTGAIADIAAYRLIDDNTIKEENMFAYTFEAPQAVSSTNTKEYKSIFNILNSGDLVTHVAPSKYGLKRIGKDIDLYSKNIDKYLKQVDNRFRITSYKQDSSYANESEMVELLLNAMSKKMSDPSIHDMSTRENYYQFFEGNVSFLIGLFMTLKSSTVKQITTALSNMQTYEYIYLLQEDGMYKFLKPILDNNSEVYDDAKLKESTNTLATLAANNAELLSFAMNASSRNNLQRSISFHYLEVGLVLLNRY